MSFPNFRYRLRLLVLFCLSALALSMQSKWHGYKLSAKGKLKSHSSIAEFSLILIHPSHEKNTTLSSDDYMKLLFNDTTYEVNSNKPDTEIPNNRQFHLFENSSYYTIESKKDAVANQTNWNGKLLKPNRRYLIILPETRRYFRRPVIFFKTLDGNKLTDIQRDWHYLKFN
jgi:hypothetical protein